jgi:hypothetical protein
LFTVIDCVVAPLDHEYEVFAAAVSVTLPPLQKVSGPLAVTFAFAAGLTVTVCEAVAEQPFASVTATVYVVVEAGVTVIDDVVAPVDHENDVPPLAVSVALVPAQIADGPEMVAVGSGLTVMVCDALFVQPRASVTVTVYVVVEVGVTVIVDVVAPVDQRYEA